MTTTSSVPTNPLTRRPWPLGALMAALHAGCSGGALNARTTDGMGGSAQTAGEGDDAPKADGVSGSGGASTSAGTSAGGNSQAGGASSTGGANGWGGASSMGGVSSTSGAGHTGAAGAAGNAGVGGDPAVPPGVSTACRIDAISGRVVYVAPSGAASNSGATAAQPRDLPSAIQAATPGDTLLLTAGKYAVPYVENAKNTLSFTQRATADKPIRLIAISGRAELDFSFPEQAWVQDSYGLLVSGSYWSFCGIDVTRAGYQGAYVTGAHNTFENCTFHDNRNTGLEINKGGSYTTVINSDAYRNYDPKKLGSMADGFGPKETQGPGNRFIGCRAWENSDDGYDAYNSPEAVIFEGCYAFRNGVDVWGYGGFAGNGNGFKVGGLMQQANHRLTRCVAFANPVKGFDQNNNSGGVTLHNCTGYKNGTNFAFGGALNSGQQHDLKNNVSLEGPVTVANAVEQNNSWTLGLTPTAGDFKSLDMALATAPRNADGSLPNSDFLRLAAGTKLIDAGVDVQLPFNGSAPDLGAFEAP